jgi:hypothetical protein
LDKVVKLRDKQYGAKSAHRRLEAAAHPLAMVMLVQKDVEELNKEDVTKLFVEVYGDREKFLKFYIEELDKADTVIDEMTQTRRKHCVREEEEEVSEEDLDTKIEKNTRQV